MQLKSFRQKDRYGNEMAVEFYDVPPMQTPEYDHPGEPRGPDTVPAWLTPGEYVVNAEAVRMFEPEIEAMNEAGREVQRAQGGTIPEYKAGGGDIVQDITDFFTMPSAPPGIEYRRMPDGSIGKFTEKTGTGGGQTYLGKLEESKPSTGRREDTWDFSSMFNSQGGPIYAADGQYVMPDFLSDEALDPIIQGIYGAETSFGNNVKTSPKGAIGPMQILPTTAADPGYGVRPRTEEEIMTLEGAQEFAKDYLRGIHRYNPNFDLEQTVTSYHSGANKVKDNNLGEQGQSYFSKVMSGIGDAIIPSAEASTLMPELDKAPPVPTEREGLTAEGDRKRVAGNAEEVANSFQQMETKRLANLEAGRPEFNNINEKTYNGLKEALAFQQQQLLDSTEKSLTINKVDPGLSSAAMEATRKEVTELGIPTPDDIETYNSPEYQSVLDREGATPPTVSEFQDNKEKEKSKDNNAKTAPSGTPQSFANQIITQTKGAKKPNNLKDVEDAAANADRSFAENALEFFKNSFSEFFSDRELIRMAIQYTGSRVLGYDHQGSLNFAVTQFVNRDEALHKGIKDNKAAYTAQSYTNYLKSRNPDALIVAQKPTDIGDNLFLPGSKALVPSYTRDGVTYVRGDFDGDGVVEERTAASVGAIKPIDDIHNMSKVSEQFLNTLKTKESSLNKGVKKGSGVGVVSDSVASQATELYFKELARFGRTPGDARSIKTTMKRALERWAADVHKFKSTGEGNDPSESFEYYYQRERVIDRTSIPLARFGDTSVKNIASIMNTAGSIQVLDSEGNSTLMNESQYKEYFDNLLRIYNYAKNNNKNMHGFDFDDSNSEGYNGFAFFIHALQTDPTNVNNPAVRMFNENKDAVLKRP